MNNKGKSNRRSRKNKICTGKVSNGPRSVGRDSGERQAEMSTIKNVASFKAMSIAIFSGGAALIGGASIIQAIITLILIYLISYPLSSSWAKLTDDIRMIRNPQLGRCISGTLSNALLWLMPPAALYVFAKTSIPGEVASILLGIDAIWYFLIGVGIIYFATLIFLVSQQSELAYGLVWVAFGVAGGIALFVPEESGLVHDATLFIAQWLAAVMAVVTGFGYLHKRIVGRGDAFERAWSRYLSFIGWRFIKK